ncbi:MAG TPA: hypothetical protein VN325_23410 [Steroidobacteraceae bacterium]|nr:hypothetical protein [Steroidobacteraceae bacterium]
MNDRKWWLVLSGMLFSVGCGFLAATYDGPHVIKSAHAQPTGLGPNATSVALSTTSAQVLGTNPTRHGLTICNPSAIVEYFAPSPVVPLTAGGVGVGLPAIASGVTSCYSYPIGLNSGIGQAINAVSASATPNITLLEFP